MSRRDSSAGLAADDDSNSNAFPGTPGSPSTTFAAAPSGFVSTYARVRPLLKDEAKKIPEYFPIARPAVITSFNPDTLVDQAVKDQLKNASKDNSNSQLVSPNGGVGKEMVVVMDPDKKFVRRKNGAFAFKRVFISSSLNEFEDPPVKSLPPTNATDIYTELRPVLENTCNRLNSCIIVCGGQKSGKMTTLFGDTASTDPEARGILPRFAADVFRAIKDSQPPNAEIKIEIEFVEVSGDTMIDLLLPAAERTTAFPIKIKDEGHSLVTLTNATKAACSDGAMMMSLIKSGLRSARKKDKTSHLVLNFRVTEKAEFEHPEDPTQKVTKVSRFWTQFVLVAGMPTAFVRCIDIAAQRDSGQSALKVPVRDSTVTRVCSEAFGGNCDTHCVVCASPYYAHCKESHNSLEAVSKFCKVKTRAVVSSDSQTSTFRKLHDEMAGLSTELKQTNAAQDMVQRELEERQARFDDALTTLEDQQQDLERSEQRAASNEIIKIVKALRLLRLRKAGDQQRKELEQKLAIVDDKLQQSLRVVVGISTQNELLAEQVDGVRNEQAEVERARNLASSQITDIKNREEELIDLKKNPGQLRAQAKRAHQTEMANLKEQTAKEEAELKKLESDKADAEKEKKELLKQIEALDDPFKRRDVVKKENDKLVKEQQQLNEDVERLKKEIAAAEERLKLAEGCSCVIQ